MTASVGPELARPARAETAKAAAEGEEPTVGFRVEIQTTNSAKATAITLDSRASVQIVLDRLKNADDMISVNAGGADSGQTECYIPVRSVTAVLVSRA